MSKSTSLGILAALILTIFGACGDAEDVPTTQTAPPFQETAPPILDDEPVTTQSTPVTDVPANPDPWARTAVEYRGQNGAHFTYQCPSGGPINLVWGTWIYTDDSSVCTAAVHAGYITVEEGGEVIIAISVGQDSYMASTANGVTTQPWGAWEGSFLCVG